MQAVFWTGLLGSLLLASSLPSCAGSLMPAVTHTKTLCSVFGPTVFPFQSVFSEYVFDCPENYRHILLPVFSKFPCLPSLTTLQRPECPLLTAMPTLHGLVVLEALTVLSMARSPSDGFTDSCSQNDFPN